MAFVRCGNRVTSQKFGRAGWTPQEFGRTAFPGIARMPDGTPIPGYFEIRIPNARTTVKAKRKMMVLPGFFNPGLP